MTRVAILGALTSVLVLVGCGNDTAFNSDVDAMKGGFKHFSAALRGNRGSTASQVTGEMISQTLASNPNPMSLVTIDDRNASGIVSLIEVNGAYRTYGNSSRQAVVFRNGLLSATRGVGDDLMSSDIGTAGLIHARKAGQSVRVNRYLDGEGKTNEVRLTCTVGVGGRKKVGLGTGRVVSETCVSEGTSISNSYVVNGQGQVIWSRQWHGAGNGYLTIQPLRL